MQDLSSSQRKFLSARASALKPVVMLGKEGPTPNLVKALDAALEVHELVKLKFIEFKEERKSIAPQLAEAVKAQLVRVIGNTAVYYRPCKDPEKQKIVLP